MSAENSENLWTVRAPLHTEPHWGAYSAPRPRPVMCSETVGLRKRPVSDQKIGLGLAGFVLCCEIQSCHARRQNDLG